MADNPTEAIGGILADLANNVTKRALASDPATRARLAPLAGKRIEIACSAPPMQWSIQVEESALRITGGPCDTPSAIVRGNALQLASWLLPGAGQGVQVEGDVLLLTQLKEIFSDFAPDLAEPLSRVVGSVTADTLLGTFEMGLKSLSGALAGAREEARQRSSNMFVQQGEFDALLDGIDTLRLRVDRLAAKVKREEDRKGRTQP